VGSDFLNVFLEYGSLGLFAAFLVWQHLSMQKRFDKMVDNFQVQIEKIRDDHKKDTEELRSRYDLVISTYNDERTQLRSNLASKVKGVKEEVDEVNRKVDSSLILMESVSLMLKNMSDEQKMRELAKEAARNKT
jgi:hypothetical protein